MLLVAFCFARSPSNEFWNAAYEIPDDVEVESQDGVSQVATFESTKTISNNAPSASTKVSPLPLGKMIRDYANRRPRDRWRERSVSRAVDVIFASRRKTAGLPPSNVRPSADDFKFQVPNMIPRPSQQLSVMRRNHWSWLPPHPLRSGDSGGIDTMPRNLMWLYENIRVNGDLLLQFSSKVHFCVLFIFSFVISIITAAIEEC